MPKCKQRSDFNLCTRCTSTCRGGNVGTHNHLHYWFLGHLGHLLSQFVNLIHREDEHAFISRLYLQRFARNLLNDSAANDSSILQVNDIFHLLSKNLRSRCKSYQAHEQSKT